MFDRIAKRYDLINRTLSFGQDTGWRKALITRLPEKDEMRVLDVATGTAEVLLALRSLNGRTRLGVGIDLAPRMLSLAKQKTHRAMNGKSFSLLRTDARYLGFADNTFDAVTVAFGLRNIPNLIQTLSEVHRVLKPGGRLLVLEFSFPSNTWMRHLYLVYLRYIMPVLGGVISGEPPAYRHLNQTIERFPYGEAFCQILREADFCHTNAYPMTFGVTTLYEAEK